MRLTGPHMIRGYAGDIGHPPVAKAVNFDIAGLQELRHRVGDDCLIVARWTLDEQPLDHPQSNSLAWFDRYIRPIAARLAMLHPLVIEGYNEIAGEMAKPHALFESNRLNILHAWGLRGAAISSAVGNPDYPQWHLYDIALDEMEAGDVLSRHEYWVDGDDLNNNHHVCRQLHDPEFISRIPTVITEAGRDIVEKRGRAGWKLTCDEDTILNELSSYDDLMATQENIVGITPFTLSGDDNWNNFFLDNIWDRVVARGQDQPPSRPQPVEEKPQGSQPSAPVVEDLAAISASMREGAWGLRDGESRGHVIHYNPDAAFQKYAREHGCGAPITPEFDMRWRGELWRGQGYALGIVFCKVGDWGSVQVTNW